MAIEDIDNLTRPLSDLVGEQGEKAARRKKQLAEVRATRAAGMTADEAKAAAERGDFGEVGQELEGTDFLSKRLVKPTDFDQEYYSPVDRIDVVGEKRPATIIDKAFKMGFNLLDPRKKVKFIKNMVLGTPTEFSKNLMLKGDDIVPKTKPLTKNVKSNALLALDELGRDNFFKITADNSAFSAGKFDNEEIINYFASKNINLSKSQTGKIVEEYLKKIHIVPKNASKEFLEKTKTATPLNIALREIGEENIGKLTDTELTNLIKRDYGINLGGYQIARKKLNTKPFTGKFSGNKGAIIENTLKSIPDVEKYSFKNLIEIPQVKKMLDENNITLNYFKIIKSRLGIKQPTEFLGKAGVDENELINFIINNPTVTTPQLKQVFPKLAKVSNTTLNDWRLSNKISKVMDNSEVDNILIKNNPDLQKQLNFVSQAGDGPLPSNIPIKHKEAFSEVVTINKDGKPLDVVRTKIVQAHPIGQGAIFKGKGAIVSNQIIKSKIAMIPDKFLKDVEAPKFFLTRAGNDLHREIEDLLILALVNKYDKLGYNFVNGAWKQTRKVNQKSVSKELKDLEKEIDVYKKELKDIDAYTLFYNPIKDKMITYGQDIDKVPGLAGYLNKVKSGDKKLLKKDGGIISIFEMTKPLNAER